MPKEKVYADLSQINPRGSLEAKLYVVLEAYKDNHYKNMQSAIKEIKKLFNAKQTKS